MRDLVAYFHDCLQADRRGSTCWNIFDRKTEHRIVLEGEEQLVNGLLPFLPVPAAQGLPAEKAARLYAKERDLVYGAFFLIGTVRQESASPVPVCAPLLMCPASIRDEAGQALLSVDLEERRFNTLLLDALCANGDRAAALHEELLEGLPEEVTEFSHLNRLEKILKTYLPGIDAEALYEYPRLKSEASLRSLKAAGKALLLVPASAVALIQRSGETLGVLTELDALAEAPRPSPPLGLILGQAPQKKTPARSIRIATVPAVLNAAQQKALRVAAEQSLSLVVGPPGTGKSFTVASIALEHLSRGQTVLIASRTDQAVDVIGHKIEEQLRARRCVVRGGRRQYLRDLTQDIDRMLHGLLPLEDVDDRTVASMTKELTALECRLRRLKRQMQCRNEWEIKWGRFLAERHSRSSRFSPLALAREKYLQWSVRHQLLHSDLVDALMDTLDRRIELAARRIRGVARRRVAALLARHRPQFVRFLGALKARRHTRREAVFGSVDFGILLGAFPIWLVNLSDAHRNLPMRPGLFDLVIIDEATQCDIASCLPILQRGKRAVVTGDPAQLRHLSFLSGARQRLLAEQHGLNETQREAFDYRDRSLLDLVGDRISTQDHVTFLDEHYRSLPAIIDFSNSAFYRGALRIMTRRPMQKPSDALQWRYCSKGCRAPDGVNAAEADALVAEVVRLVEEQAALDESLVRSIGILSPFRDQVDAIERRLGKALSSAAIQRHRIMLGTAHTFQGEERDVMFLSMALDPDAPAGAYLYLNKPDQFNVSITRARHRQVVFTSVKPGHLDRESLFHRYLAFVTQVDRQPAPEENPLKDRFLKDVAETLQEKGVVVWPAFDVAGTTVDLVIARAGRLRGIDLVGYPGQFENAFSLDRYTMFHRAGLGILPLPYASWMLRREECLERLARDG